LIYIITGLPPSVNITQIGNISSEIASLLNAVKKGFGTDYVESIIPPINNYIAKG